MPATSAGESESDTGTATETDTAGPITGDTENPASCEPLAGVDPLAAALDTCDAYAHTQAMPEQQVVVLHNNTSAPILVFDRVSGCQHIARRFTLSGTAGTRQIHAHTSNCELDWPACEMFLGVDKSCLLCQTLHPPAYIEPGGTFTQTWIPAVLATTQMPDSCTGSGEQTCGVAVPLGPGNYVLEAIGAPASNCGIEVANCQGGAVDADGSCLVELPEDFACEPTMTATGQYNGTCQDAGITFE